MENSKKRCAWCGDDPLYVGYHDNEWGDPIHDREALFECLCLEGQQAGLSWITVLRKREHYRKVFHGFKIKRIAKMSEEDVSNLLQDAGIIRHRGKIEAIINNAKAVLAMEEKNQCFVEFVWSYAPERSGDGLSVPSQTEESVNLSKALKKKGFRFVGPTTVYAFMQAVGMVDDHSPDCFKRRENNG